MIKDKCIGNFCHSGPFFYDAAHIDIIFILIFSKDCLPSWLGGISSARPKSMMVTMKESASMRMLEIDRSLWSSPWSWIVPTAFSIWRKIDSTTDSDIPPVWVTWFRKSTRGIELGIRSVTRQYSSGVVKTCTYWRMPASPWRRCRATNSSGTYSPSIWYKNIKMCHTTL